MLSIVSDITDCITITDRCLVKNDTLLMKNSVQQSPRHSDGEVSQLVSLFVNFNVPATAHGCIRTNYIFKILVHLFSAQVTTSQVNSWIRVLETTQSTENVSNRLLQAHFLTPLVLKLLV